MTDRKNPQSKSQPGATNDNPNEDVENGTQSQIQPGGANEGVPGGQPTQPSVPSDGGNPAANQGGASQTQ
jgi:hypothetical protein